MTEPKELIERVGMQAPTPHFTLDDVRARREHQHRRRRQTAGIVGVSVTLALVLGAVMTLAPLGGSLRIVPRDGGAGLPPATRAPISVGPGEYSYQHILYDLVCGSEGEDGGEGGDVASPCHAGVEVESWWRADDSGRVRASERRNFGIEEGTFGPGEFRTEGDLSEYPLGPAALEAFLLQRSGTSGASPRPEVTPAPGVPLNEGLLWNAIRDYLGSTQYLNSTPALRASLLEVLATVPMVRVDERAIDPAGRDAIALRFFAYEQDVVVFVDPATHDFLAMTGTYRDGARESILMELAGAAASVDDRPAGADRSISPP